MTDENLRENSDEQGGTEEKATSTVESAKESQASEKKRAAKATPRKKVTKRKRKKTTPGKKAAKATAYAKPKFPRHTLARVLRFPSAILEQNSGRDTTDKEACGFVG